MRKLVGTIGSILMLILALTACTSNSGTQAVTVPSKEAVKANQEDFITITDKLFVGQINDIYLNVGDYLGKTVHYEGVYREETNEVNGNIYRYVTRFGPGCCSYDANPGFEVIWDKEYPEPNDWVEVTGMLVLYEEEGHQYLGVSLISMEVKEERGQEYVTA